MSPLSFLVVLGGCLAAVSNGNTNPSIVVRMNQGFFDFVYQDLEPMLLQKIMSFPIPVVNYHIPVINTDLALMDLHLTQVKFEPAWITPAAATRSLDANMEIWIRGSGAWVSRARWWPHIKSHGTLDFSFNPLHVQVGISMEPGPKGVWKFDMASLVVSSAFDVKFHGGFLKGLDVGALRKYINKKAGDTVTSTIRNAISNGLATVTPYMEKYLPNVNWPTCGSHGLPAVCKDFAINLALTSNGIWHDRCYAELQFNGVFAYKNKTFFPGHSVPFPPIKAPCGDHGVSVLISQGTFSSAVDALFASGLVNLNIPSRRTANDTVFNHLIPGLYDHFGNSSIFFDTTLQFADLTLLNGKAINKISFRVQLLAKTSAAGAHPVTFKPIADIDVKFTIGLAAYIAETPTSGGTFNIVFMKLIQPQVNSLTVLKSAFPINGPSIQKWLQGTIVAAVNTANDLLTMGVAVVPPTVHGARIVSPQFLIADHHLKIAVDLYKIPVASGENKQKDAAEKVMLAETQEKHNSTSVPNMMEELVSSLTNMVVEGQDKLINVFAKSLADLL